MENNWFYKDLSKMQNGNRIVDLEQTVCPVCKTERADFLETMFVGCPNCYQIFANDIAKHIENYHGAKEHVGKVPEKVLSKEMTKMEIDKLNRLKAQAVANEDYLLADVYLQKIKSLKGDC